MNPNYGPPTSNMSPFSVNSVLKKKNWQTFISVTMWYKLIKWQISHFPTRTREQKNEQPNQFNLMDVLFFAYAIDGIV